jgi:hypothetical protein
MKKLRDGRRYCRALAASAESFRIDLSETSWIDLWHTHILTGPATADYQPVVKASH